MAKKRKKRRNVYRRIRPLRMAAGLAVTAVGLSAVSRALKEI